MKTIPLLLAAWLGLSDAYAGEPRLKEAQVIEMAKLIAKKFDYEQDFVFEKATYVEKTGVWTMLPEMVTSAGIHFFEIRDKDYYFRVGFMGNTGYSPKSSEKFRLSPTLRSQFKKIVGEGSK